jgi:hypothetical protein
MHCLLSRLVAFFFAGVLACPALAFAVIEERYGPASCNPNLKPWNFADTGFALRQMVGSGQENLYCGVHDDDRFPKGNINVLNVHVHASDLDPVRAQTCSTTWGAEGGRCGNYASTTTGPGGGGNVTLQPDRSAWASTYYGDFGYLHIQMNNSSSSPSDRPAFRGFYTAYTSGVGGGSGTRSTSVAAGGCLSTIRGSANHGTETGWGGEIFPTTGSSPIAVTCPIHDSDWMPKAVVTGATLLVSDILSTGDIYTMACSGLWYADGGSCGTQSFTVGSAGYYYLTLTGSQLSPWSSAGYFGYLWVSFPAHSHPEDVPFFVWYRLSN